MKDVWRAGNDIELLINGEAFFPRVFDSIRKARREVLIETFIIREDEVGKALQQTLMYVARRGVHVEITIDAYGGNEASPAFFQAMADAGVHVHLFEPTRHFFTLRLNVFRRLHRKLVVVDNEVAFIGGINYCADQLSSFGEEAKQDYAVRLRGPVVQDIHQACLDLLRHGETKARPFWRRAKIAKTPGNSTDGTRALLTVRDNGVHKRDIEKYYLNAIHSAKERLVLAHAYFFPSYGLLRALRNAARRGVDVTLILQGEPDMPWVRLCAQLLYGYLMREGVKIYEYNERPFHGKLALADRHWATLGSSNLDPLSLSLNLEANVVVDDEAFNQRLFNHLRTLIREHGEPVSMQVVKRRYWWRMPLIFLSFHFLRHFPAIVGWLPAHAPKLELVSSQKHLWKKPHYDQERA
ncbi:cardiolipin synthase ClsB [Cellvibrio sp. ARAG 10.3]|uniref:cardiolipin synthase ClsB n=1 Tax=Cellvibrio sp. ARAG 10.3 TaxID=3451358 RepID=UPI003F45C6C4